MATLHVDIVAAEGQIFAGEADAVFAPAITGELGILARHAPLLTKLKAGAVRVKMGDKEESIFVGGGILEVQPKLVTILADSALRAEHADEAAAEAAQKSAAEKLAGAKGEMDLVKAQQEVAEASARLKFVQDLKKTAR
jgi:F-type H+-transporting ATPase subunit epsilon